MLDFTGRTMLVVGGSSGIGNAIAQAFRRQGAAVHIWGTRPGVEDYADEHGSNFVGLTYAAVDVTNDDAVAQAAESLPDLDILVLSQGVVAYRQREFEMATFRRVLNVNLTSMMGCATAFHSRLARSGGSLILIGSTASLRSTLGNPAYSASKSGMLGLTRTLGEAWVRDGIRVNAIAPGMVATKLTEATTRKPERLDKIIERIPARRLGLPEEIAGAALFLASSMASYIVGQMLVVDGGLTLA